MQRKFLGRVALLTSIALILTIYTLLNSKTIYVRPLDYQQQVKVLVKYEVQPGDRVYSLFDKMASEKVCYDEWCYELEKANKGLNVGKIKPYQTLLIPAELLRIEQGKVALNKWE